MGKNLTHSKSKTTFRHVCIYLAAVLLVTPGTEMLAADLPKFEDLPDRSALVLSDQVHETTTMQLRQHVSGAPTADFEGAKKPDGSIFSRWSE